VSRRGTGRAVGRLAGGPLRDHGRRRGLLFWLLGKSPGEALALFFVEPVRGTRLERDSRSRRRRCC
jgi:hypothetical protein